MHITVDLNMKCCSLFCLSRSKYICSCMEIGDVVVAVLSVTMCIQTQELISKRQRSVVQCIVKCCFPLVITISDSVLSPSKFDDIHVFGMHILGRTNVSSPCVIRMSKKHRIYLNDINIQLEKVSGTQNSKNANSRQTRDRGKEEHMSTAKMW